MILTNDSTETREKVLHQAVSWRIRGGRAGEADLEIGIYGDLAKGKLT